MAKITIVVGLPGSGKSTYSKSVNENSDDDFLAYPPPKGLEGVIGRLRTGTDCVVNDVTLCDEAVRDRVVRKVLTGAPGTEIEWHYFENNPRQCIHNVLSDYWHLGRSDVEPRLRTIRDRTLTYRPPADVILHPVLGDDFEP